MVVRRHLLLIAVLVCAVAAVWALLVAVSGGFVIHLGALRISSRRALNPSLVAVAAALLAWALSRPDERRRALERVLPEALEGRGPGRVAAAATRRFAPPIVVGAAMAAVVWFGLSKGL